MTAESTASARPNRVSAASTGAGARPTTRTSSGYWTSYPGSSSGWPRPCRNSSASWSRRPASRHPGAAPKTVPSAGFVGQAAGAQRAGKLPGLALADRSTGAPLPSRTAQRTAPVSGSTPSVIRRSTGSHSRPPGSISTDASSVSRASCSRSSSCPTR